MSTIVMVVAGISLLVASMVINQFTHRQTIRQLNHGHSSAFRNYRIVDPLSSIKPEEITTITQQQYQFTTPVSPNSNKVMVSLAYRCIPQCSQLWLMTTEPLTNRQLKFLVHHPILNRLQWFSITDHGFNLYQRHPQFASVGQLLQANVPSTHIVVDSLFVEVTGLQFPQEQYLEHLDQLPDSVEYVITSYQHPATLDEWMVYMISIAVPTTPTEQSIQWQLTQSVSTTLQLVHLNTQVQ